MTLSLIVRKPSIEGTDVEIDRIDKHIRLMQRASVADIDAPHNLATAKWSA